MGIYSNDSDLVKALKLLQGGYNTYAKIHDYKLMEKQRQAEAEAEAARQEAEDRMAYQKHLSDMASAQVTRDNTLRDDYTAAEKEVAAAVDAATPETLPNVAEKVKSFNQMWGGTDLYDTAQGRTTPGGFSDWFGITNREKLAQADDLASVIDASKASTAGMTAPKPAEVGGGSNTMATALSRMLAVKSRGEELAKITEGLARKKYDLEQIPEFRRFGFGNPDAYKAYKSEVLKNAAPDGLFAGVWNDDRPAYDHPDFAAALVSRLDDLQKLGLSDADRKLVQDNQLVAYDKWYTAKQDNFDNNLRADAAARSLVDGYVRNNLALFGGKFDTEGNFSIDISGEKGREKQAQFVEFVRKAEATVSEMVANGSPLDYGTLSGALRMAIRDNPIFEANIPEYSGKEIGMSDSQWEYVKAIGGVPGDRASENDVGFFFSEASGLLMVKYPQSMLQAPANPAAVSGSPQGNGVFAITPDDASQSLMKMSEVAKRITTMKPGEAKKKAVELSKERDELSQMAPPDAVAAGVAQAEAAKQQTVGDVNREYGPLAAGLEGGKRLISGSMQGLDALDKVGESWLDRFDKATDANTVAAWDATARAAGGLKAYLLGGSKPPRSGKTNADDDISRPPMTTDENAKKHQLNDVLNTLGATSYADSLGFGSR